jgi:hypothetical protein
MRASETVKRDRPQGGASAVEQAEGDGDKRQEGARSMSMNVTERQPIRPDDPDEVFAIVAALLSQYSDFIAQDIDDILAKFPGPEFPTAAVTAYVAKIGEDIPDETIRGSVKRLAAIKFRNRGMA